MKFQLKALVAALALVAAVPANAAMNLAATGDSSLILTLVDNTTAPISATFDLGPTFTTFDRTVNQSWDLTAGAYASAWTAFANVAGANKQWGVYTADSLGGTVAGDLNRLVTATALGFNQSITNTTMASSGSLFDNFITASNNVIDNGTTILNNHGSVANGANFVSGVNATNAASGLSVNAYGSTGRIANSGSDTNGAFDTNLNVWTLTRAGGTLVSQAVGAQLNVAGFNPFFNLSSTGVLTYTAAAVPEPETYAMFLAGLGMMGFVARRRKSV